MSNIKNIIPENFICPITLDIMRDPVICDDGFVYDRHAIAKVNPAKSPFTRRPINLNNLKPNTNLKKLIDNFIEINNITLEPIEQIKQIEPNINIKDKHILVSTFYYNKINYIKVRGIFDNILQAEQRARYLQQTDKSHKIMIANTSYPYAFANNNILQTTDQNFLDETPDPCLQINGKDQKFFLLAMDIEAKTYIILDGYETSHDAISDVTGWSSIYPHNDIYLGDIGLWIPISFSTSNSNEELNI